MKSLKNSFALLKMSTSVVKKDTRITGVYLSSLAILSTLFATAGYSLYTAGYFKTFNLDTIDTFAVFTPLSISVFFIVYIVSMGIYHVTQAYVSDFVLSAIRNQKTSFSTVTKKVKAQSKGIMQFTVLSSTVGMVLKALEEKVTWIGSLSTHLAQGAWNLATVFAIVTIVDGQAKTGVEATRKSVSLLIQSFGENVIIRVSLGVITSIVVLVWLSVFILALPIIVIVFLGNLFLAGSIAVIGLVSLIFILFYTSLLESVITVMLYEYVTNGKETTTIDKNLFKYMITSKNAKAVFNHA